VRGFVDLLEVVDGDPYPLQRDAGVEEALDDRRVTRSWKEYSRWVPEPCASRIDGVTSSVRAQ
jgi:hypothetical protein